MPVSVVSYFYFHENAYLKSFVKTVFRIFLILDVMTGL
jgi:hypothetical protein